MPKESKCDTLLEELEELGLRRLPKSRRQSLPKLINSYLTMVPRHPEGKMSQRRERELDIERLGFCKAQLAARKYGADLSVGGTG